jgi:cell wall arabinan synthesis protein/arabinosyltransferase-like concanavalin domain-containing protein
VNGAALRPLRSRLGLALALVVGAVLFAGVGAGGPAHSLTATYAWPPATLPGSVTPARLWYSPLLLTRGTAEELHATIPCSGLAPPLRANESETLVLATMRHPRTSHGLAIVRNGELLSFRFGESAFGTAPLSSNAACGAIALDVRGDQWTLRLSSTHTETGNFEGQRPEVTGLFSGLDLRAGAQPRIVVTTDPYGAHASWWQWPMWAAAIALAFAALVIGFGAPHSRQPAPAQVRGSIGPLIRRLRPVDGLVVLLVGTWWLIGPVLYDDGWVKARQTNGIIGDGFSNYYTTYGKNLPLDFWTEWLQHWVVANSNTLIVQRLPTVLLLAGTWIVCRTALTRLLGGTRGRAPAEWALGLAFVLNTVSWGMTLRPEPFVALLLISVFAIALRFTEQPSGWQLAAAGMLVALALAAHPAGLITLAPLFAIGPHIVRWARDRGWTAPVLVGGAVLAIFLTVVTAGSDLHQRLSEARLVRLAGDATASWRGELTRYEFGGAEGTTLRHLSIALMLAALIGYVARNRRSSTLDLPATTLAFTLILLIATPSKWAWHFGALAGLAALVVAAEIARLRADSELLNWPVRPLLAFGVAILMVSWSMGFTDDWSSGFGLRTLSWTFGFERKVTLVRLGLVGLAFLFAGFVLFALVRHGRAGAWRSPWALVPWLVPLVVLPLVVFNIAMFAADAVKTPAWTLASQNVDSLRGRGGCGLADDTRVAAPWSLRPLKPVGGDTTTALPGWLAASDPPGRPAFAVLGRGGKTGLTLPWFQAPGNRRVGFYVLGTNDGTDSVRSRWGHVAAPIRMGDWGGIDVSHFDAFQTETVQWVFVPQGLLPRRGPGLDAVQLALDSRGQPPHAIASTGAVSYESTTLSTLFRLRGARPLIWPNLLLYMPCARQPRLDKGVVEVPTVLVAHSGFFALEFLTSPFHGLVDLYGFRDLSVADSKVVPQGITVLWVERRIPGAAIVRAQAIDS